MYELLSGIKKQFIKNLFMKLIIKLFGILMLLSGISLLIKPEIIFGWIENKMENTSLSRWS